MSIRALEEAINDAPYDMRRNIMGYARAVREVLPEIFREAGKRHDENIANQVIFLAGIKKFFSIVDSTFWMLDNSASMAVQEQAGYIMAGSRDLSKFGNDHSTLFRLRANLIDVLIENNIYHFMSGYSYPDIIKELVDGY